MKNLSKLVLALVVAGSATTAMAREHGEFNFPTIHNQPMTEQGSNQAQQQDIFDVLDAGNQK